jgi:AraC family transcriptional regulator
MKKIAAGRIVFWQGGSAWVFHVPAAPEGNSRNDWHSHHAFQLTFSLGGEFKLHLRDRCLDGPCAVVAPDAPHAFEASGLIAHLFVEPESRAGRALLAMMKGQPAATIGSDLAWDASALIRSAFEHPVESGNALREVGMRICNRIGGGTRTVDPDRRVRHMVKWAGENLERPLGMKEAAVDVGLSSSRASHLFVEETGLPFRTYVLWLRLVRAVDAHARGLSLTDAAQEGGFSDSAHLSRTFKRMFGLPAGALEIS